MALTGVHIVFGYCSVGQSGSVADTLLLLNVASSQTMAAGGTSTISAPRVNSSSSIVLSLDASAPIFYAVGATPVADGSDAAPKRRYYDPARGREDIFCNPGDKVAWVLA